jgi:excisionase family DNA binding protein
MATNEKGRLSDFAGTANRNEIQGISHFDVAQSGARQSARHLSETATAPDTPLGPPLSIREVARMLGCSAWTVRQKLVPGGLPHFRSGPQGKLVFFRDQVVAWILSQQMKRR